MARLEQTTKDDPRVKNALSREEYEKDPAKYGRVKEISCKEDTIELILDSCDLPLPCHDRLSGVSEKGMADQMRLEMIRVRDAVMASDEENEKQVARLVDLMQEINLETLPADPKLGLPLTIGLPPITGDPLTDVATCMVLIKEVAFFLADVQRLTFTSGKGRDIIGHAFRDKFQELFNAMKNNLSELLDVDPGKITADKVHKAIYHPRGGSKSAIIEKLLEAIATGLDEDKNEKEEAELLLARTGGGDNKEQE